MENEYSSLITGIDGLVYQKSVPFRDRGEDRTVNMSSNLPKNITPSTYSKSEDNIVTFNLSPEMKTMYPQSTAKIGDKEVSVLSLEEPMQFNPGSVTSIEINWNDVYREYFTIKIAEKQDKPEPILKNYFYINFTKDIAVVKPLTPSSGEPELSVSEPNVSRPPKTETGSKPNRIYSEGIDANSLHEIQVSSDQENWLTLDWEMGDKEGQYFVTIPTYPTYVYIRSIADSWCYEEGSSRYYFSLSANTSIGGNIMSLLYGPDFEDQVTLENDYTFCMLFQNTPVIDASKLELPATTLSKACYHTMFADCTSLINPPIELPATTLSERCYAGMFNGCSSLAKAPKILAINLAENCCGSMFASCSSLTSAPNLLATELSPNCYGAMFNNCDNLTTAPALPATKLASQCYYNMFYGCPSLTNVPSILPATNLEQECYRNMFYGCISLVEAPELPAMGLAMDCYRSMFNGCTSLTSAPELPATELTSGCYRSMFSGCTSLTNITVNADDISADSCTYNWVKNVPSIGVFHNNGTATYEKDSANGIPEGWIEAREGYCYVNLDIVVNGESDCVIALFNEQQETYSKPGIIELTSNSFLELRAHPTSDKSQFDGWYDINGNLISNNLFYQCIVTEDRIIVAQFKAMPAEECTVTINIDKYSNKDAIMVNGTMYESNISIDTTVGSTLTLVAVPDKSSSSFVGWFDGDKEISLDPETKLTVDGDINITARFSEYMAKTTISVNAFSKNDQVTADGVVVDDKAGLVISKTPGSTISLIATPDEGSLFKEWYDETNKTQLSAELSYTYTVGDYDVDISAVFKSNK